MRRQPESLQKSLSLGLTLGVSLAWTIALASAVLVTQQKLNDIFDSALKETAQRIMPIAVVEVINREDSATAQDVMPFGPHDEQLTYLVRNKKGDILLKSHNADVAVFNQKLITGFSSSATHRLYSATAIQASLYIEVAESIAQRRKAIRTTALALLWPLLLLIPLCFVGTWFFVRYGLRNLLAYRNAIETRDSGDLSPISVEDLPIEIKTIATSINYLLERLRGALESERAFTANSAHELRTPIATTLAQVQRLQQIATELPVKQQALKIENSLRGLSNLSEKLMQLAKAEGGGLLAAHPQNLNLLLHFIVEDFRRSTLKTEIQLTLLEHGEFLSIIDPDAFSILVRNLLDNALKHGATDQPVELSFSSEGVLRVVNAGNIVNEDTLAQLRRRFVRSNTATEGSGLGLAIAEAIATGIGATMTLISPATDRKDGFEVVVHFPRINGPGASGPNKSE